VPSKASVARGRKVTITARSTEALASSPRLIVVQPGLAGWKVRMVKTGPKTYAVTIRLKAGGSAGTVRFRVVGTDKHGGRNQTALGVPIS
jgi:hypothetical protein